MRKTIKLFLPILLLSLFLAGCGGQNSSPGNMDELAEDNKYHYRNKMLGFSVALPDTFEYYQTQRIETEEGVTDLEIYVPTNDRSQHTQVPGYANPITIRIFSNSAWQARQDAAREQGYQEVGEQNDRVYTIKFWAEVPGDWEDRWDEKAANGIKNSFELL